MSRNTAPTPPSMEVEENRHFVVEVPRLRPRKTPAPKPKPSAQMPRTPQKVSAYSIRSSRQRETSSSSSESEDEQGYKRWRAAKRQQAAAVAAAAVKQDQPRAEVADNNKLESQAKVELERKEVVIELESTGSGTEEKGAEDLTSKAKEEEEGDKNVDYLAKKVVSGEERIMFCPPMTVKSDNGTLTVFERLGVGAYGNVYRVKEEKNGKDRALKIMGGDCDSKVKLVGWKEAEVLCKIFSDKFIPNTVRKVIVNLHRSFKLNGYPCLLTECLGPSMAQVMASDSFQGFSVREIRRAFYQILVALNYLHSKSFIHHDIKPGNIAFVVRNYEANNGLDERVKLIDFGSTTSSSTTTRVATTCRYRSPEIGLKGWSSPANDIWSVGCTFFEMYAGHPLFATKNEVYKYYLMEAILCEQLPVRLLQGSDLKCFDANGKLIYTKAAREKVAAVKPLECYNVTFNDNRVDYFFALLKQMLRLEYTKRIDSFKALGHVFFFGDSFCQRYQPIQISTKKGPPSLIRKLFAENEKTVEFE